MAIQGFAELDAIIARVRRLPDMIDNATQDMVQTIESEIQRTIDAGTTPYGVPWKPRDIDGGKALRNAFAAVTVKAAGGTIYIRITGIDARHNNGQVRQSVKRQVIPRKVLPDAWVKRLTEVLTKRFAESTGK